MQRELVELGRYRLDRGWSYRRLVDAINAYAASRRSDFRMSLSNLHGLLNNPKTAPNAVTMHVIRGFLTAQQSKRDRVAS